MIHRRRGFTAGGGKPIVGGEGEREREREKQDAVPGLLVGVIDAIPCPLSYKHLHLPALLVLV